MQIRRAKYLFVAVRTAEEFVVQEFFRGTLRFEPTTTIQVVCPYVGEMLGARIELVQFLLDPRLKEWQPPSVAQERGVTDGEVLQCIHAGVLYCDSDETSRRFAALEAQYERLKWDPYAALYHNLAKDEGAPAATDPSWGIRRGERGKKAFDLTMTICGPPPAHFHTVSGAKSRHELDLPSEAAPFFELLRNRKTCRFLDRSKPMDAAQLSTLLYYTFGCQGYQRLSTDYVQLKKTSPSGGALHPIEAYPLLVNVQGLASGIYHYNVESHALDLLRSVGAAESFEVVPTLLADQQWFASAHVVIFLVARFYRHFWKYGPDKTGYKILLMDAAHLSQTAYLVCTQLGLGSCLTACINKKADEFLGIDPVEEGIVAALGCGVRKLSGDEFGFDAKPFIPRSTRA